MGTTPQLQLTATLQDFTGIPVQNGQLIITLCGFGLTIPKIIGTSLLAKVGPVAYTLLNGVTSPNISLWGNDVITPPGTFYTLAVVDNKQNVVQCNMYQFTGSGLIDLSVVPPIIPSPGGTVVPNLSYTTSDVWLISTGATPGLLTYAQVMAFCNTHGIAVPPNFTSLLATTNYNGAPPGALYTLSRDAFNDTLISLFYNGNALLPGIHYTLIGQRITLGFGTNDGENLYALYVATSGTLSSAKGS